MFSFQEQRGRHVQTDALSPHQQPLRSHVAALLPNPELITWAQAMSRNYDVRFALEEEALPHLQTWLENLGQPAPGQMHPSVELNPNNSGELISRIKTKQSVRRREYALLNTEFLAIPAALLGGSAYPQAEIGQAW